MPSRREYNMVRGMIDRDRERIHKLAELLCDKFPAPLSQDLIELRALQVRSKALKSGSGLTHAECVIFSFLEAARQSGMREKALKALAEAQLLDANLRLGLSKVKLASMKFVVEVSGSLGGRPILHIDGTLRSCRTVELDVHAHGRTYLLLWRPLLADCLMRDFGTVVRRVSAVIEGTSGYIPLKIALKDSPREKRSEIDVVLDPRRFFYDFTTRKEIEVDVGVPISHPADSDAGLMLRKIGKQLDNLNATTLLFNIACGSTPSGAIWAKARDMIAKPANSQIAVSPRKKAAAAILAADMQHFARLDAGTRASLAFAMCKFPLTAKDSEYASARGLIVPSEFSTAIGMEWNDTILLAVKF